MRQTKQWTESKRRLRFCAKKKAKNRRTNNAKARDEFLFSCRKSHYFNAKTARSGIDALRTPTFTKQTIDGAMQKGATVLAPPSRLRSRIVCSGNRLVKREKSRRSLKKANRNGLNSVNTNRQTLRRTFIPRRLLYHADPIDPDTSKI